MNERLGKECLPLYAFVSDGRSDSPRPRPDAHRYGIGRREGSESANNRFNTVDELGDGSIPVGLVGDNYAACSIGRDNDRIDILV